MSTVISPAFKMEAEVNNQSICRGSLFIAVNFCVRIRLLHSMQPPCASESDTNRQINQRNPFRSPLLATAGVMGQGSNPRTGSPWACEEITEYGQEWCIQCNTGCQVAYNGLYAHWLGGRWFTPIFRDAQQRTNLIDQDTVSADHTVMLWDVNIVSDFMSLHPIYIALHRNPPPPRQRTQVNITHPKTVCNVMSSSLLHHSLV